MQMCMLCSFFVLVLGSRFRLCVGSVEDALCLTYDVLEHCRLLGNSLSGLEEQHTQGISGCRVDGLLFANTQSRIAEIQALIEYECLVEHTLAIALVHDIAFEPLGKRTLGGKFGFNGLTAYYAHLEVACKTASCTCICKHNGEYGKHEVCVLGAFYTLNSHKLSYSFEFAVNTHLALIEQHGCICGYHVITLNTESYVELCCYTLIVAICFSHNSVGSRP